MRHTSRWLLSLVVLPALALGQVVINPTGGTGSTDGIRVSIGNTGQIQVLRNGTGQLYAPGGSVAATTVSNMDNGVYLAVGNTVVGPQNFATTASAGITLIEWTPISNTFTPQGNGGTATTVLRGVVAAKNYDLTVTWQYTYPNDFVIVTHSLVVPAGNTSTIRLYHVADAFLGGDDFGPSFFSLGPPALVGGYRPASNIVEAWRFRSGIAWTGYFAGYYGCLFDSVDCPVGQNNSVNSAGTFTNYVEPTTVDNSFGIMWNFGSTPGTYVTQNDLTFYSFQPQLSKRFGTTVITVPASTTLTFTIDNVPGALPQTNLGFTDTFPSGLVLANSSVTNTCGGSVTSAAGGAIAGGGNSVRLAGAGFAMGTSRCTITVNVTSSTAGAYVNGMGNISGVSVLANTVTDQTLSVVQGAPIVRLDPVGTINAGNATAYRVSGSCQDTNGVVTVRVGSAMTTTPCSNNAFTTTLSVAALADGSNISVSGSQTNGAGTGTDSATTSKDTTLPGVPGFTSPAGGAFVNDSTPTINGTGEVGTTVRVYAGTTEVCTAVVSASGTWSCVASMVTDGTFTLTARATDPAGNTGTTSPGRSVTIDTMPPAAPVVTNPAAAATVAPNPSISGTSEALATVLVFEGSTQLCSTPADASGQWSCPTSLTTGMHTIFARQIDRATNSGPNSANRVFSIANVPTVTLDTPLAINATNVTAYPVAGNCTVGSGAGAVTIRVGTVMSTTTCAASRFSTTVNASSLADGPAIVLTASQANMTGTGTDTRGTVKDTVAPATPTLTAPADMSFINTTTPTFTGTGEPGSTVRVTRSGVELCSTVVPTSGMWACTSSALLPGLVTVTARATDAADNTSGISPTRSFTIDIQAPVAPIISTPTTNAAVAPMPMITGTAEPLATVSVFEGSALVCSVVASAAGSWNCSTVLGSGPHTVVARQTDQAGNVSPDSPARSFTVDGLPSVLLNTPGDINSMNGGTYVVSGACTSTAGEVSVSVGLRTVMVPCANGQFSATIDVRGVADGTMITVRASQTTAAGTGADTRVVRKDATAPGEPIITEPKMGAVTTSNTPPISGSAEPGATVTVLINGNPVGTATANAMGSWTFTPPTPLADGTYVVSAQARDASGNEGARGMGVAFTIDSTAPNAPNIAAPLAESTLDDDRPLEVSGFAEPLSSVTVYVDGKPVGTTTADANGRFSVPVDASSLGNGPHVVTADARDAAGNLGPKSADVRFTLRTVDERFGGQGLISCSSAGALWWGLGGLLLRRRRRNGAPSDRAVRTSLGVALLTVLCVSSTAFAQQAQPLPGFSLTRFTLNDGGLGALTSSSGDTLPRLRFRATLGLHYENNPLVYYRDSKRVGALVAHRVQLHLGLGFGITSWLQLTGELPLVVAQTGDDLSKLANTVSPDAVGLGSPRLALRLGILSQGSSGLKGDMPFDLAFQLGMALPFGAGNALNIESGFNLVPQLSAGRNLGPVRIGGEVSAFIRQAAVLTSGSLADTVGSQLAVRLLVASTGDGARFEGSFHSLVSLEGTTPPGFELLGGARIPVGPIELFAIAGPGFGSLPGTPTVRVLAGVGLKPQANRCEKGQAHSPSDCPELDDDDDGILNRRDACPLEPEDRDQFEDDDGCIDPDNDHDRINDVDDKCPIEPGPRSNGGCPVRVKDNDNDGTLDVNDKCPTIPGPKDHDGCPIKDTDLDGVEDDADACPTEAGPKERRGCPLHDRDEDTVEDKRDNCPDAKGPPDNQGCPVEERQLVIITSEKLIITDKVFFATGKATILPVSFPLLNQVAQVIRTHSEIPGITVEGHTDDQGSAKLNRKLSLSRAKAVVAYLEHQGVDSARLNAMGYGPDRPADTNKTEVGRSNNRRVEFIIEAKPAL